MSIRNPNGRGRIDNHHVYGGQPTETSPSQRVLRLCRDYCGDHQPAGNTVTYHLGELAPGRMATSTLVVITTAVVTITNTPSVSSDGHPRAQFTTGGANSRAQPTTTRP